MLGLERFHSHARMESECNNSTLEGATESTVVHHYQLDDLDPLLERQMDIMEQNLDSLQSDTGKILTELVRLNSLLSEFNNEGFGCSFATSISCEIANVADPLPASSISSESAKEADPIPVHGTVDPKSARESMMQQSSKKSLSESLSSRSSQPDLAFRSLGREQFATMSAGVILESGILGSRNEEHARSMFNPAISTANAETVNPNGYTSSETKLEVAADVLMQFQSFDTEEDEFTSSNNLQPSENKTTFSDKFRSFFGISRADLAANIPGSRTIHPASPFMAVVELLSAILLVYSVGIVPVQLSLWNKYGPCQKAPTMEIDMFVDLFFMSEVVIRFFVGVDVNGKYYDNLNTIAKVYITSPTGAVFDALTSIPLSWVDYYFYEKCLSDGTNGGLGSDGNFIRVVKTLRILKLSRLLKVFKFFSVIEERLDISPGQMRLFKVLFSLATAMHLYSCAFWRVKTDSFSDEDVLSWMQSRAVDPSDDGQIYVVCLYFICTVFPTVGFGDISALNHAERIFCIFMLCSAACFFALILSELQEIYASSNLRSRELIAHLDSVIGFLRDNRVPYLLERRIKKWVRFQYVQQKTDEQSQSIMDNLPPVLRLGLAGEINKGLFAKVPFWSRISNAGSLKDRFSAQVRIVGLPLTFGSFLTKLACQLLLRMHTAFHPAGSCISRYDEPASGIRIILAGRVKIYLPGRQVCLLTVGPGSSIGDNCILGDYRWAGMYGVDADFVADDNCKTCIILDQNLKELIFSSASFIMIRWLINRYKYIPEVGIDEKVQRLARKATKLFSDADADETQMQRDSRYQKYERQCWGTFHWIRLARIMLQLVRAHPTIGRLSKYRKTECRHMPVVVPSLSVR